VKITWPPDDLASVCGSATLLRQRFGENDATVMQILTVLHQANTMKEVRRFKFLQLFLITPTGKREGNLLIRHKEIDVNAYLLGDDSKVIARPDDETTRWLNQIRQLRITTITDNT
jgi:hypothetical protein